MVCQRNLTRGVRAEWLVLFCLLLLPPGPLIAEDELPPTHTDRSHHTLREMFDEFFDERDQQKAENYKAQQAKKRWKPLRVTCATILVAALVAQAANLTTRDRSHYFANGGIHIAKIADYDAENIANFKRVSGKKLNSYSNSTRKHLAEDLLLIGSVLRERLEDNSIRGFANLLSAWKPEYSESVVRDLMTGKSAKIEAVDEALVGALLHQLDQARDYTPEDIWAEMTLEGFLFDIVMPVAEAHRAFPN